MKKKNYPLDEVTKFETIKEMMQIAVDEAGDKVAYKFRVGDEIKEVTYREFSDDTMAIGTALANLGFGDKHISLIGENSYNWISIYLSVLKSEGVFIPVDKELPLNDIINVVNHSDSEILFYAEKYEKDFMANADKMKNIKYFIGLSREEDDGKFLSFKKFKENGRKLYEAGDTAYADMQGDPMAMKMIVYTSGTTGMSKGVMLSEHNLVSCVYYGLQVSRIYDVGLSVLPYHHTYEAVAGLLVYIHHHATTCINENLRTVLKNLGTYKPDYIYLVPAFVEVFYKKIWAKVEQTGKATMLRALIKTSNALRKVGIDKRKTFFKAIHDTFGGNLRKIVCGGAPIRPELGEFFESIGISLINGYGITECSPLVSANRDEFNDCRTVGMVLPCCDVTLADITPDGDGEICVKGDIVMMGYYKEPTLTEEVLKDGVFYTGDYGRFDEHGRLMITGRKKNIIVLENGKNIYPEEIENYIYNIPYVAEAVVFAIKDENGHEQSLGAEVFLSAEKVEELGLKDPESTLKADISKACAVLPSYKHITKVYVRATEFEKTTTNKIKRNSVIHK